jgi:tRNA (cytidine/uridine-2'-O-)-methyltransferase
MRLVLFEPEIPPNTGNVARLCAATRTPLHLIEPLGFQIDDKHLKRAGLDYWPHVSVRVHRDWEAFLAEAAPGRIVLTSARQGTPLHHFPFDPGDTLVLGPETRGLPEALWSRYEGVRIPIWGEVRSLNLSTAAGVVLYEALRQTGALEGK